MRPSPLLTADSIQGKDCRYLFYLLFYLYIGELQISAFIGNVYFCKRQNVTSASPNSNSKRCGGRTILIQVMGFP